MDEKTKQEFKEFIVQAMRSGGKETGNLVADLKKEILDAVRDQVKITVNGKIDGVKEHLKHQDKTLEDIQTEQMGVRQELVLVKQKTEPLIESRKTVLNVGRFVIWVGAIVTASSVIFWTISKLLKL